jgi:hypothetical protein
MASGLLFRDGNGNVSSVLDDMPKLFEARFEPGHADRRGSHVYAAPGLTEVEWNPDNTEFLGVDAGCRGAFNSQGFTAELAESENSFTIRLSPPFSTRVWKFIIGNPLELVLPIHTQLLFKMCANSAISAVKSLPLFGVYRGAIGSRIQPVQRSRKRNRLPNVFESTDPRHDALDTHTKAAVRHAAILPQIEIPLERLFRQIVLADSLYK